MPRELRERNILITGASRGIGRCLAERLSALGSRLALTARSSEELAELAAKLRASGTTVVTIPGDLTRPEDRRRIVETTVAHLGGLDVLVNNAGLASFGEFATSTEDVLRTIMEINFFAPVELIRLCLPHLKQGVRPAVVNVASVCGRRGIPTWPEHSASKFALVGLSEAIRAEFSRFRISVLIVLPGLTRADDLDKHLLRNEGKLRLNFQGAQPPDAVAKDIVWALRWNWPETNVGFTARWLLRGQRYVPFFINWLLARMARRAYRDSTE